MNCLTFEYLFLLFQSVFINAFEHSGVLSNLTIIVGVNSYFLYGFLQVDLLGSWHSTIWTWAKHC